MTVCHSLQIELAEVMVHLMSLILFVVGILAITDFVIHVVIARIALHRFETSPRFGVMPPPADGPVPEPIQIATTDQLTLEGGIYFPDSEQPRGVVVFCPEMGGRFDTAMNYAPALLDAGFAVVSFSFRNQEPSQSLKTYRSGYWVSNYEVRDVLAAIHYVESHPEFYGLPIGLMGVSRGAGAALSAASLHPEITQVWAQGAFSNSLVVLHHATKFLRTHFGKWIRFIPQWHIELTLWFMQRMAELRNGCRMVDLERLLPSLRGRRILFVSGERDNYVPTSIPDSLHQLAGCDGKSTRWIVPRAGHNMERTVATEEFDERLVGFFEQMVPVQIPLPQRKTTVA
jgi:BAAT / Acyl-CoA thioester hydrolase C terminal.